MHHFWESLTLPILKALKPEIIVEVGSYRGDNTKLLWDFCKKHSIMLHIIDPAPDAQLLWTAGRPGDGLRRQRHDLLRRQDHPGHPHHPNQIGRGAGPGAPSPPLLQKVRRDRAVGVLPAEPQEGYREIICT